MYILKNNKHKSQICTIHCNLLRPHTRSSQLCLIVKTLAKIQYLYF